MTLKAFQKKMHEIEELYIGGDICDCCAELSNLRERIEEEAENEN